MFIPDAVLETILTRIAAFFLAAALGDINVARRAAMDALAGYNPQNEADLRHAAMTIAFSYHALDALSQSMAPDMPITRVLRLRGSAVSLHREAQKARAQLKQDQRNQADHEPYKPQPSSERAAVFEPEFAEPATPTTADTAKPPVAKPAATKWTPSTEEQQRIAASIKRAEARVAAYNASPPSSAAATKAAESSTPYIFNTSAPAAASNPQALTVIDSML